MSLEQYQRPADAARSIAGTLIISVNDHPDMRPVFAGLPMREVPVTCTVRGTGTSQEMQELVIGNWTGGWPRPLTAQLGLAADF